MDAQVTDQAAGQTTGQMTGLESAGEDFRTRAYWTQTGEYVPQPQLREELRADVAIVGGGFTGLHAAIALKESNPGMDIVIVDGAVCGYGGSTRNGGFCMTMYDRGLADFARDVGDADAKAVHVATAKEIDALERFCVTERIDADIHHSGIYTISNGAEQDARVANEYETAQRLGLNGFHYLDRDAMQAELHSEWLRCGVFEDSARMLNPAKLTWGLRDAALRRGIRIYEMSPVTSIESEPETEGAAASGRALVKTTHGAVSAERVLVATNAFCSVLPQLRKYMMTFYAYIILTEPLTDEQWSRVGWRSRAGMEDRRVFHHYFRPTVDGRILWGGRDAPMVPGEPMPAYDRHDPNFQRLEETFREALPQLDDIRFEHRWGGPIAATGRFVPFVGWTGADRRILHAAGYTGHGVGPSTLIGKTAADLLMDRQTDRTELIFVRKKPMRLPPEPFRRWVTRGSSRLLQKADDESHHGVMARVLDWTSRAFG